MKKYLLTGVVIGGILLSGCIPQSDPETAPSQTGDTPAIEEKKGDTTKTGVLVKQGEKYYLKLASGAQEEIESYAVDFEQYLNAEVTVIGQYSGDTLFVGQIQ